MIHDNMIIIMIIIIIIIIIIITLYIYSPHLGPTVVTHIDIYPF